MSFAMNGLGRRRWRRWVTVGLVSFGGTWLLSLCLMPQAFVSSMSLSIIQPTEMGAGLLSSAAGLGASPNAKYAGVLRSHRFAEEVEQKVNLQQLYHLKTRDDAIEMIQESLSVNDNSHDNLIYVSLSLRGPSLLWPFGNQREEVKNRCAAAVNAYVDLLSGYMVTSDDDRNLLLSQGTLPEIKKARAEYDLSVERVAEWVRSHGDQLDTLAQGSNLTGGASSQDKAGAEQVASGLQTLYAARATLEEDIQSATASLASLKRRQAEQLRRVDSLPLEDPLLMQARTAFESSRAEVDLARLQFGPDHPQVVLAQDRLNVAQRNLNKQVETIKQGNTTPMVAAQVHLDELRSRYATVLGQLTDFESHARLGRDFITEFERRRNEVLLRLEVLKAASSHAATLSMQTIATTKHLAVVDVARPARHGNPGAGLQAVLSLFVATFAIGCCWLLESRKKQVSSPDRENEPALSTGTPTSSIAVPGRAGDDSGSESQQRAA